MAKKVTAPSGYKRFMAKVSTKDKAKIKALAGKEVKQSAIAKIFHTRKENIGHYLRTVKVGKRRAKGGFWDVKAAIQKAGGLTSKEATKVTRDLPRFKKPRTERQKAHLRNIIRKRKREGYRGKTKAEKTRWAKYNKAIGQAREDYDISEEDFEVMAEAAEDITGETPK